MPIFRSEEPAEMDKRTTDFLIEFADGYKDFTESELVNLTHRDGYPWKQVYNEGKKYTRIPFDSIIRVESLT